MNAHSRQMSVSSAAQHEPVSCTAGAATPHTDESKGEDETSMAHLDAPVGMPPTSLPEHCEATPGDESDMDAAQPTYEAQGDFVDTSFSAQALDTLSGTAGADTHTHVRHTSAKSTTPTNTVEPASSERTLHIAGPASRVNPRFFHGGDPVWGHSQLNKVQNPLHFRSGSFSTSVHGGVPTTGEDGMTESHTRTGTIARCRTVLPSSCAEGLGQPTSATAGSRHRTEMDCAAFSIHSVSTAAQVNEEADDASLPAVILEDAPLHESFPYPSHEVGEEESDTAVAYRTQNSVSPPNQRTWHAPSGGSSPHPRTAAVLMVAAPLASDPREFPSGGEDSTFKQLACSSVSFHSPTAVSVKRSRRGALTVGLRSAMATAAVSEGVTALGGPDSPTTSASVNRTQLSGSSNTCHTEGVSWFTLPSVLPTTTAVSLVPAYGPGKNFGVVRPARRNHGFVRHQCASGCDQHGLRRVASRIPSQPRNASGAPQNQCPPRKPSHVVRRSANSRRSLYSNSFACSRTFLHSLVHNSGIRSSSDVSSTTTDTDSDYGELTTGSICGFPAQPPQSFFMAKFSPTFSQHAATNAAAAVTSRKPCPSKAPRRTGPPSPVARLRPPSGVLPVETHGGPAPSAEVRRGTLTGSVSLVKKKAPLQPHDGVAHGRYHAMAHHWGSTSSLPGAASSRALAADATAPGKGRQILPGESGPGKFAGSCTPSDQSSVLSPLTIARPLRHVLSSPKSSSELSPSGGSEASRGTKRRRRSRHRAAVGTAPTNAPLKHRTEPPARPSEISSLSLDKVKAHTQVPPNTPDRAPPSLPSSFLPSVSLLSGSQRHKTAAPREPAATNWGPSSQLRTASASNAHASSQQQLVQQPSSSSRCTSGGIGVFAASTSALIGLQRFRTNSTGELVSSTVAGDYTFPNNGARDASPGRTGYGDGLIELMPEAFSATAYGSDGQLVAPPPPLANHAMMKLRQPRNALSSWSVASNRSSAARKAARYRKRASAVKVARDNSWTLVSGSTSAMEDSLDTEEEPSQSLGRTPCTTRMPTMSRSRHSPHRAALKAQGSNHVKSGPLNGRFSTYNPFHYSPEDSDMDSCEQRADEAREEEEGRLFAAYYFKRMRAVEESERKEKVDESQRQATQTVPASGSDASVTPQTPVSPQPRVHHSASGSPGTPQTSALADSLAALMDDTPSSSLATTAAITSQYDPSSTMVTSVFLSGMAPHHTRRHTDTRLSHVPSDRDNDSSNTGAPSTPLSLPIFVSERMNRVERLADDSPGRELHLSAPGTRTHMPVAENAQAGGVPATSRAPRFMPRRPTVVSVPSTRLYNARRRSTVAGPNMALNHESVNQATGTSFPGTAGMLASFPIVNGEEGAAPTAGGGLLDDSASGTHSPSQRGADALRELVPRVTDHHPPSPPPICDAVDTEQTP